MTDIPKGIRDGDELPDPPAKMFKYDPALNVIHVWWGGYDYEVDLDRIKTPLHLLHLVHHLSGKGWKDMTPDRLGMLIEKVCRRKGWDLFADC